MVHMHNMHKNIISPSYIPKQFIQMLNSWSLLQDTGDHCEIFTLSEEVKATYHHNNKRWYVQPQKKATTVPSSSLKPSE